MRITLLLAALSSLPFLTVAQTMNQLDGAVNNRYALGQNSASATISGVQGDVFLLPAWTPGRLQLNGGGKPFDTQLKYDLYRLEVHAKRPTGDSVVVPLMRVKEFNLAARRFVCYPAPDLPAELGGGCGEVLYEGPAAQLLKFERKDIVKRAAPGSTNSYVGSTTAIAVLETRTRYYLRWASTAQLVALKPKRASLEQALAGHPAALAALKARKGSIGTEAELVAALTDLAASF